MAASGIAEHNEARRRDGINLRRAFLEREVGEEGEEEGEREGYSEAAGRHHPQEGIPGEIGMRGGR